MYTTEMYLQMQLWKTEPDKNEWKTEPDKNEYTRMNICMIHHS